MELEFSLEFALVFCLVVELQGLLVIFAHYYSLSNLLSCAITKIYKTVTFLLVIMLCIVGTEYLNLLSNILRRLRTIHHLMILHFPSSKILQPTSSFRKVKKLWFTFYLLDLDKVTSLI